MMQNEALFSSLTPYIYAVYVINIISMYSIVFVFLCFSKNLDTAQRRVNGVLERKKQPQQRRYPAGQNKGARTNNPVQITFHQPEENAPLLHNSKIQLGDRVRIMNPSRGQQSKGIVISTTESGGLILVKTRNVKPVRRNPKNCKLSAALIIIVLNNKLFLYLFFFVFTG